MHNFTKQIKIGIVLFASVVYFTTVSGSGNEGGSWETLTTYNEPGYDEHGQDIDECILYAPCPEGYVCVNLPGSYRCDQLPGYEGEDGGNTPNPNPGEGDGTGSRPHSISARCWGTSFLCSAICQDCLKLYTSYALGKANDIQGICICGKKNFKAL